MIATVLDMRRNPKKILDAIARNETVTLSHRGKAVARILPIGSEHGGRVADHPAFGMWAQRDDLSDPADWVRQLRTSRLDAL